MKRLSTICHPRIAIIIALLTFTYVQSVSAQSKNTNLKDSLSTLLLNKKWYLYQVYEGTQSIDVPKAQRGENYFLFDGTELLMNIFGDKQGGKYTLDLKNRIIVFQKENGGSMKIVRISKEELKLEVQEEQQETGFILRANP
jgi:hypothetical protein